MPSEMPNATALPAENAGILKKSSGSIARGVTYSHERNAAMKRTPSESTPTMRASPQPRWGDALIVGVLSLGVLFMAAFLSWEYVTPRAMLPLDFFKIPAFSAGNAVAFGISLGMFGTFFFFSL